MHTIGQKLEEARKRENISLREASEATKIRSDFLVNFENNEFDLDMPELYVRGFLRIYGKFLKLDTDKLLADYTANQLGASANRSEKADGPSGRPETYGRVELDNYSGVVNDPAPGQADSAQPGRSAGGSAGGFSAGANSLYVKVGVIAAVVILFFGLVGLLLSMLTGSESAPAENRRQTTYLASDAASAGAVARKQATARAANAITLRGTGASHVMVRDAATREILYQGELQQGKTLNVNAKGAVEIVSTEVQFVQVERAGKTYSSQGSGLGKFQVQ